ncbi:DUF1801 domain-containing protein [Actinomyces howellii]|uniref:Uncharacterized conserved protein n=1 Tax=Actinomyces howellii TaxID=52771 RepID=A0A3S4TAS2_9ACTO|nr:DUF1801 domain-containing protein [Actinomyces howellii]VEG29326.1 Uncharacterized conserved protein [Actinomyces howellii]
MEPTPVPVDDFLATVPERRAAEAHRLIDLMREVTGAEPVMWGPSIIGYGSAPYRTAAGTEGLVPAAAFSPRKAAVTVYLSPALLTNTHLMGRLGRHKVGKSCLYLSRLDHADSEVLRELITRSFWEEVPPQRNRQGALARAHLRCVADYLASVALEARPMLDELRDLVRQVAPEAEEVVSYGLIGYRMPGRSRAAKVFVSGWRDHVALYPQPDDEALRAELSPWVRGKGTVWFSLSEDLPTALLERVVASMTGSGSPADAATSANGTTAD